MTSGETAALRFWGSDCVLEGGCEGNTTPDDMCCDSCGSDEHTVPLYVEDSRTEAWP